jgi:triosephosphate isomerase
MRNQNIGEDASRRRRVVGNWKMAAALAHLNELAAIAAGAARSDAEVVICPPMPLIPLARNRGVAVGAQDCHHLAGGAYTGSTSAPLLAELGATHVILGHSERRRDLGESNALVRAKAEAALAAGLIAIICVGEAATVRAAGRAEAHVTAQVDACLPEAATADRLMIAYEPLWSIGTGTTPTAQAIAMMHGAIRRTLEDRLGADRAAKVAILYGGSVSGANAGDIMGLPNVDGVLVGGASLMARDFLPIVEAAAIAPMTLAA